MVVPNENATQPYGLPSLFAGAGAQYAWKGICNAATKINSAVSRDNQVYWWIGPDGGRILMKWYSFLQATQSGIGGYAEANNPSLAIDFVDQNSKFTSIYPYSVIGVFGYGGDALKSMT